MIATRIFKTYFFYIYVKCMYLSKNYDNKTRLGIIILQAVQNIFADSDSKTFAHTATSKIFMIFVGTRNTYWHRWLDPTIEKRDENVGQHKYVRLTML